VEANNLNYIRYQQNRLRAELYQKLADHVEVNINNNDAAPAGVPIVLPSSYEGSMRNMRERCADAMSIFAKFGAPDLFITFTANPRWTEITENLLGFEQPCDRPDLVARIFRLKLKALMQDLTMNDLFGKCIAFAYTIEFQKRGLPHAHILLTLQREDKFTTASRIDQFMSAEIPSELENPRLLREIVLRCMMHGPCGTHNISAPCMEAGVCKKGFPKPHQDATEMTSSGYPAYRRCEGVTAVVQGAVLDNRFVVPYNPFLLQRYNAHINVEICTSIRAVKYIYKYIYKGFDCANMVVTTSENRQVIQIKAMIFKSGDTLMFCLFVFFQTNDEIRRYLDARYVSAPEAMWRLREFPMHDRSHMGSFICCHSITCSFAKSTTHCV
jgi:Helitron helicase-like domain at N-terminus